MRQSQQSKESFSSRERQSSISEMRGVSSSGGSRRIRGARGYFGQDYKSDIIGRQLAVTRRGAAVDAFLTTLTLSPTSTMVGALSWFLASLLVAGVQASALTLQSPRFTIIGPDATPLRNEPCVSLTPNVHICI